MSTITNNVAFHTKHGDAPSAPTNNIVLRSFSISLHKRWPEPDKTQNNLVLQQFSIALHKRYPVGEPFGTKDIMHSMSLGYYGWKYLNQAVGNLVPVPPIAIPIHHK